MAWAAFSLPQWFKAMRYEKDSDHNHVHSFQSIAATFLANLHLSFSSPSLASDLDSSSSDSPMQRLDLVQAPVDGTPAFRREIVFQCSSIDNFFAIW